MMKPFGKRDLTDREAIYNYRCSRVRRIIENVFGVITSRFRVLHTEISFNPEETTHICIAIATLHNILRRVNGAAYMPSGTCDVEDNNFCVLPGVWRMRENQTACLAGLNPTHSRNSSNKAKEMREKLADYFISEPGAVPWQNNCIHNTHENLLRNARTLPR